MKFHWEITQFILFSLILAGCSTSMPMRHLSSDVCLVMPESTSRAEVLSFLGEPDRRQSQPGGSETWFYYKKNESFLRQIPILGPRLGWANYEVVTISFTGEQVRTCIYRQLEEEEFQLIITPDR